MKKGQLKIGDKVRVKNWLKDKFCAEDGSLFLIEMRRNDEITIDFISNNGNFTIIERNPSYYYSPEFVDISYEPGTKFTVRTDLHEGDFCDGSYFLNEMRSLEPLTFCKYNKENQMLMNNAFYYSPEMLIPCKE